MRKQITFTSIVFCIIFLSSCSPTQMELNTTSFLTETAPPSQFPEPTNTRRPIQPVQPSSNNTSWFAGGTLHRSTIREWRQATYSNRLATSADFIASTQNVDYGNLDKFKQMATDLEKCISIASSGGSVDDEKTSFIAAMCTAELFP